MQLGDIAMKATRYSSNVRLAEEWYLKSAKGCPPQPGALFQLARMHHEVRQMCKVFVLRLVRRHDLTAFDIMLIEREGLLARSKVQCTPVSWLFDLSVAIACGS